MKVITAFAFIPTYRAKRMPPATDHYSCCLIHYSTLHLTPPYKTPTERLQPRFSSGLAATQLPNHMT